MKEITITTPAKINLSIDITGKLENGYHTVEMIMQSVGLYDEIIIEKTKAGISVQCDQPYVPNDQRNTAWKAADLFFSRCPVKGGARIALKKSIPVSAGLAGGSTDAAGVLKGLNILYENRLTSVHLVELARMVGADAAFCLAGGTQLARGVGDELTVLPDFADIDVVLVKPPFPVSTAWAYKNLKLDQLGERPDTFGIIQAIEELNLNFVANNMRNVLESVTIKRYPEIRTIMNRFKEYGALGSRMSGSGPTVFGLFSGEEDASDAARRFLNDYKDVFCVKTVGRGEE